MQEVEATLTAAMKYRAFLAMNSWLSTTITRSLTASDVAQQIGAKVDKKKHKRHHSRCLIFCNNHRSCASIPQPLLATGCWNNDHWMLIMIKLANWRTCLFARSELVKHLHNHLLLVMVLG